MSRRVRVAAVLGIICVALAAAFAAIGDWQALEVLLDVAPLTVLALPLLFGR